MNEKLKIAAVQMEPKILEKDRNLTRCLELIQVTAREGAQLIVFPECALTGYVFTSLEEALPLCESIPGPSTEKILSLCRELNVYVVLGLLEREAGKCYNAAALLGSEGKGSTNGTYLNNKQVVAKTPISTGDMFLLGTVWLRFDTVFQR